MVTVGGIEVPSLDINEYISPTLIEDKVYEEEMIHIDKWCGCPCKVDMEGSLITNFSIDDLSMYQGSVE